MRSQIHLRNRDGKDASGYDGGPQGKYPFGYYGGTAAAALTFGAAAPAPGGGVLTTAITIAGGPSSAVETAEITLTTNAGAVVVPDVSIAYGENASSAASRIAAAINGVGTTGLSAAASGAVITLTAVAPLTGITAFSIAFAP